MFGVWKIRKDQDRSPRSFLSARSHHRTLDRYEHERKRKSSANVSPPMSESSFLFVSDASARQRNAHASRNSLQAKKRRGNSLFAAKAQQRITRGGKLPWVQRSIGEASSESPRSDPESIGSSSAESDVSTPSEDGSSSQSSYADSSRWRVVPFSRSQNPTSQLGAGRVDPFGSFPIRTNSYISQLIDHCESVYRWSPPTLTFKFPC